MLAEEEEEEGGDVGSALRTPPDPPPQKLEPYQASYLASVERRILGYSALAMRRQRRFRITAVVGLVAALLVPVAIAAGTPGWAVATFGAVTALSQGLQQIFQDQRHAVAAHTVAVELSRVRRRVVYDLEKGASRASRRAAFDTFVAQVEEITDASDDRMTEILKADTLSPGSAQGGSPRDSAT